MNYSDTLEYLFNSLPMYQRIGGAAYKANLNNTIALMDELNHPYKNFPTVHIAGTNGKGSVSHMLASAFQEAGYKTGLYTSPHLVDFRERIKINGECVSEDFVIDFVAKNRTFFQKLEPSFFEMTVAMAFSYFEQNKVDIAIIEVGMGGRLDSTNLISPILSVITNIDFDHTQFLGNSIEDIAYEKAGIIKNNTAVIIGEKDEKSLKVFKDKAKTSNSDLILAEENCQIGTISEDIFELNLSAKIENRTYNIISALAAWFQKINIRTALSALDYINKNSSFKLSKENIEAGFKNVIKNTGIYGRWQKISTSPTIICDAGHNAHSLKNLKQNFEKLKYNKLHLVLGFANDKDVNNILDYFPKNANYYFCKASVQRAMSEKDLLEIASKKGINSKGFETVPDAIKNAIEKSKNEDIIYIGGSFFVVADALEYFKNHNN